MPDVSNRVIQDLLQFAQDRGYKLEIPDRDTKFVPLEDLRKLCDALTAQHGDETWTTEFVRRGFEKKSLHHFPLRLIGPLILDPKTLYRALEWTSPMIFPCVSVAYEDLGPNLIRLRAELAPNVPDFPLLHVVAAKSFEKLPGEIGLPDAAVDLELQRGRAIMTVRLPESRSIFSRVRRAARALFRPDAVLQEMKEQELLLRESYREVLEYKSEAEKLRRNLEMTVEERTRDLQRKVTELIAAKAAAEESARTKSVFLANISHELRTPLSGIVSISQLLSDRSTPEDTQSEYVQIINQSGQLLISLFDDLLDVAKQEESGLTVRPAPCNPRAVVTEVLRLLGPSARSKGLELREDGLGALPEDFVSDAGRFRQIVVNVLGNAIKFTDTGFVGVRCGLVEDSGERWVEIEFADSGRGIPEDQRHLLFKPFSQIDGSTTRAHGGSGLGLYLSKSLANALGGDLTLKRSASGNGSIFVARVKDLKTGAADGLRRDF